MKKIVALLICFCIVFTATFSGISVFASEPDYRGINLIRNPGFESGSFDEWTSTTIKTDAGGVAVSTEQKRSGTYCAYGTGGKLTQSFVVPVDGTYTVTAYVKGINNGGTAVSNIYKGMECTAENKVGTGSATLIGKGIGGWEYTDISYTFTGHKGQVYTIEITRDYINQYIYFVVDDVSVVLSSSSMDESKNNENLLINSDFEDTATPMNGWQSKNLVSASGSQTEYVLKGAGFWASVYGGENYAFAQSTKLYQTVTLPSTGNYNVGGWLYANQLETRVSVYDGTGVDGTPMAKTSVRSELEWVNVQAAFYGTAGQTVTVCYDAIFPVSTNAWFSVGVDDTYFKYAPLDNILVNGSFDSGDLTGWTPTNSDGIAVYNTQGPTDGAYCTYGTNSSVYQAVTIPVTGLYEISGWFKSRDSVDATLTVQKGQYGGTVIAEVSGKLESGWVWKKLNSEFYGIAGETVVLVMKVYTNGWIPQFYDGAVIKLKETSKYDNLIINGDFTRKDTAGWTVDGTENMDSGGASTHGGSYYQTFVVPETGTYEFAYSYRSALQKNSTGRIYKGIGMSGTVMTELTGTIVSNWVDINVSKNVQLVKGEYITVALVKTSGYTSIYDNVSLKLLEKDENDNLLFNGDFERGDVQGWTVGACCAEKKKGGFENHSSLGNGGSKILSIASWCANCQKNNSLSISQTVTVPYDGAYSVNAHLENKANTAETLTVTNLDTNTVLFTETYSSATAWVWKDVSGEFLAAAGTNIEVKISVGFAVTLYADDVSLNFIEPVSSELSSLSVEGVPFSTEFSAGTKNYSAVVTNDVSSVTVNAVPEVSTANVTINGDASDTVALSVGENAIPVVVSHHGITSTYTLNIKRLAEISDITVLYSEIILPQIEGVTYYYRLSGTTDDCILAENNIMSDLMYDTSYDIIIKTGVSGSSLYKYVKTVKTAKFGDINDDNIVNILDLVRLKKGIADSITDRRYILDSENSQASASDLVILRRILLGVLDENGKLAKGDLIGNYSIVISDSADEKTELAASELKSYLKNISGCELPIVTDATEVSDCEIVLGETSRAGSAYTFDGALENDGYQIKRTGNVILVGGLEEDSVLNGVYGMLEKYFGCGFYTNVGTSVTAQNSVLSQDVTIPESATYKVKAYVRSGGTNSAVKIKDNNGKVLATFGAFSDKYEWKLISGTFKANAGQQITVELDGVHNGWSRYYWDDVELSKFSAENLPSDNLIVNGDFEASGLNGWSVKDNITVGAADTTFTVSPYNHTAGCEKITKCIDMMIPDGTNYVSNPSFAVREISTMAIDGDLAAKLALNATCMPTAGTNAANQFVDGCDAHSIIKLVPKENYPNFKYASDQRDPSTIWMDEPCLTQDGIFEEVVKNAKAAIASDPDAKYISITQSDGNREEHFCDCDDCKAKVNQLGSLNAFYIDFANRVAAEIKKDYPDIIVEAFGNYAGGEVPTGITLEDNVQLRMFGSPSTWGGFTALTDKLSYWGYQVNYKDFMLLMPNLYDLKDEITAVKNAGVGYIFEQANGNSYDAAFSELRTYVMAKLMWDINADVDALVNDFCENYYGAGYENIVNYLKGYANLVNGNYDTSKTASINNYFTYSKKYTDSITASEQFFTNSDALWANALEAANDVQKQHIEKSYISYLYARQSVMFYREHERSGVSSNSKTAYENRNQQLYDLMNKYNVSIRELGGTIEFDKTESPDDWF